MPKDWTSHSREILLARRSLDLWHLRIKLFGPTLGSEEPWALLLALFVLESNEEAPTIAEVAKMAKVGAASGTRWIQALRLSGWLEQPANDRNSQRGPILTPTARDAIIHCLLVGR